MPRFLKVLSSRNTSKPRTKPLTHKPLGNMGDPNDGMASQTKDHPTSLNTCWHLDLGHQRQLQSMSELFGLLTLTNPDRSTYDCVPIFKHFLPCFGWLTWVWCKLFTFLKILLKNACTSWIYFLLLVVVVGVKLSQTLLPQHHTCGDTGGPPHKTFIFHFFF